MSRSLGISVKLLHEATGHIVTVELKNGELYRGSMVECEDNWNCQLKNITFTAKDKGSALGVGRGRAVAMRARAQAAGRGGPPGRGVVPPVRR
ncbi:small nuclear ribonucleoprotein SmD3b-like [Coffea arabica]|uniref:Small nuclear ribonucleoprotein Sm D3 n=1 Tax=Coffea arabica TaxID=13443 RepID=A0A6P6TCV6_COFAR|nr:small nuclear ribonucleoprotein SmD3a-like [Coffea arabica]